MKRRTKSRADRGPLDPLPIEAWPEFAALLDGEGRILETNSLWRAFPGESAFVGPALTVGSSLLEVLEGPDLRGSATGQTLQTLLRQVLDGGRGGGRVLHACQVGDERRWLAARVVRTEGPGAARAVLTHDDVTLLRETEATLRHLLEATLVQTGEVLLQTLVRELARLVGARFGYLSVPSEEPGKMRTLAACADGVTLPNRTYDAEGSLCAITLERGVSFYPTGLRELCPSPEVLALGLDAYIATVVSDQDGAPLAVLGALHTAPLLSPVDAHLLELFAARAAAELSRLRAEQALIASEERLSLALEGTADGLFDWDLTTGVVHANPRLSQMLGYCPEELREAKAWEAISHPEDLPAVKRALRAHLKGETPRYQVELRVLRKDGSYRWILHRGKVVARGADGRALRMTGLHTDVSERKLLDAKLRMAARLASVGTLAAGLAHEINTPLTYLGTSLSVVERSLAPLFAREGAALRGTREALTAAREGAERVSETVRDIKAFSRADDSKARAVVDLRQLLDASLRMVRKELEDRAQVVRVDEGCPPVLANGARLGQVFVNLLLNAAQAIPRGEPDRQRVLVRTRTDELGAAVVEVEDTGCGIPQALASRVFDPFFTTKQESEGTGLGLSVSHRIVTEAGGDITFESAPERGTVFRVRLPPAKPPSAAPLLSERSGPPRTRLLVVDDHATMGTSLRLLLQPDHEVLTATSAESALSLLEADAKVDLILCDVMMPGISGMELYRRLGARFPALVHRVVFMTGGAYTREARDFLESARARVLEKPFSLEQLLSLLRGRSDDARA